MRFIKFCLLHYTAVSLDNNEVANNLKVLNQLDVFASLISN